MKCWGKIQNQQIPHILITPTFKCAILCYSALAILFAAFGALCYTQAIANHDLLIRYDDACNGQLQCSVPFTPTVDLVNPKIYYQLDNFYANHRNFVKSRDYKQLRGNVMSASDIGASCDPVLYMSDLGDTIAKLALDNTVLPSTNIAYPCGLIAKYFFNDTFQLAEKVSGNQVPIDETNIAQSVDRNYKFQLPNGVSNPNSIAWLNLTNEHVMVWFQMESFPTFIKLWGHIW